MNIVDRSQPSPDPTLNVAGTLVSPHPTPQVVVPPMTMNLNLNLTSMLATSLEATRTSATMECTDLNHVMVTPVSTFATTL
jgi:hypothetical protein